MTLLQNRRIPFEKSAPKRSQQARDSKARIMDRPAETPTLDVLVQTHLASALRFAIRLTGDPDRAEDVVQEALVRAARSWATFRGEAEFRTWLLQIVIHVFRDSLACRRNSRALPGELEDPRGDDPALAAMGAELGELIAAKISRLPPRQREVLVLMTYESLSVRETAEVLGISESNVHATLHVARDRLRRELMPYFAEK